MKIAILDIGTNSIHLIIGDVMPDLSFQVLDRAKDMTRLGQGTFRTGRLSAETMDRGLEVIRRFHSLAQKKDASRSSRKPRGQGAGGGGGFLERVKRTGVRVKVSRARQARLITTVVQRAIDFGGRRTSWRISAAEASSWDRRADGSALEPEIASRA
jgi:exopolyphosphatase/guanosine-5'-triphosphate,3'-diphosphate pyrophosphatase